MLLQIVSMEQLSILMKEGDRRKEIGHFFPSYLRRDFAFHSGESNADLKMVAIDFFNTIRPEQTFKFLQRTAVSES